MKKFLLLVLTACALAVAGRAEFSPEQRAKLPPAAGRAVDFVKDIQPLFEAACVKCHAKGKDKGGLSIESREQLLKGGDTGPAALAGWSAESLMVEMVSGIDAENVMPKKGTKWTAEQVGLLRAWIDQGAAWPANISFARPQPENLHPRAVSLPEGAEVHPVDRLLAPYFAAKGVAPAAPVDDRAFARRVYLDLIGLLPTAEQLDTFLNDSAADKRAALVRSLLADKRNYADHWLAFWNDLLRNDYKGAGFIDGGRKQITGWLHRALIANERYDRFVAQLIAPELESEGFTRGIVWRGNVNASMLPPMQAAQSVSQVFLGVNLKCASCHDSFVNDWALADAYGLAAVYSDDALELVHCDKPTGRKAVLRFLYPEVGAMDAGAARPERMKRLAEIVTSPADGRLSRTLVNRLWARLLGRGLVEPLDDMDRPAWNRDVLDWLAEDFVAHGYDVKRVLETICTSRAYQMPAVEAPGEKEEYVFRGPLARRMSAEQFADAVSALLGDWSRLPASFEFDFIASGLIDGVRMPKWIWTDEPLALAAQRDAVRAARGRLAEAAKTLIDAQQKADVAAGQGGGAIKAARVAAEQTAAAIGAVQEQLKGAEGIANAGRHAVIFRKRFTLAEVPAEAWATTLASQGFQVQVNGREAKPVENDGFRNGRIFLLNLQPLLVAGENVIAIYVSSHTEKSMNDAERQKFPASAEHLNAQSGLAFYVRCGFGGGADALQIVSDESWRVRRNPEGAWNAVALPDDDWAGAKPLPEGIGPVDEGPGLEPIGRRDFANIPVVLGPQLSPAVSMVAQHGRIRAALTAADPLQLALDRPNREVVVPVRASVATTMQALELTNGATLNDRIQRASAAFAADAARDPDGWIGGVFRHALGRDPADPERALSRELLSPQPAPEAVADFLWSLVNLPEFQIIR